MTKHIAIATQNQNKTYNEIREKKNLKQLKIDSEKLQEEMSSQLICVCFDFVCSRFFSSLFFLSLDLFISLISSVLLILFCKLEHRE